MIRPDTTKFRLLEMIGICGEFPADQLNRLIPSASYAEKLITELKAERLIQTHYRDSLRGYRLTKTAKKMLLSVSPLRFQYYLTGNTETNLIRSEVFRRIRLHQKTETYLTLFHAGIPFYPDVKPDIFCNHREAGSIGMRSLPLFYASREIKELGPETTKIRNSRSMGILMAPQCVYVLYNTGNGVLKWEYRTEVRLNAFLQHYLQGYPYNGHPQIRAIMTETDMEMAFRLFTSTGGYKKSLFMLDTSFEHFHYLPNTPEGEVLLKLLVHPEIMEKLDKLLLSDLGCRSDSIPLEHDATDASGNPTLLAYDFDMQRINRFNTGLNVYGRSGNLICFDFQIPSPHPLACLDALTAFPYNLYGIFLCLTAFGLLTFLLMRMGFDRNGEITDRDRNLNYSTKGTYGTSGFMTLEEMHQVLELTNDVKKHKGTILGKLNGKAVCLPKDTRMNRNIAVYGASGSMKSRAFARNMIFQCVARGESLIITDPKSELYESTATYLENAGYIVKSFNLVNPENSDSWNCLGEIGGQETMAQVFADVIIQNTGSAKGDHFWDNAEMNLLKALILYVDQGFPPEAKNIGQVYKLLTMSSEKELNSLFDLLRSPIRQKSPTASISRQVTRYVPASSSDSVPDFRYSRIS